MNKNSNKNDQIVLYTNKEGNIELRADAKNNTLWTSQDQIAQLFSTSKQVISWHMTNIFKQGELNKKSTVKESLTVLENGRHYLVKFYNLDAIIAVGYRVNSKKATKFRIWATGILRNYIIKGFNLDKEKLMTSKDDLENLHKAIDFLESKSDKPLKAKIKVSMNKDLI